MLLKPHNPLLSPPSLFTWPYSPSREQKTCSLAPSDKRRLCLGIQWMRINATAYMVPRVAPLTCTSTYVCHPSSKDSPRHLGNCPGRNNHASNSQHLFVQRNNPTFHSDQVFPSTLIWCVTYGQCPQNMMLLVMVGAEQRHLSWMLTGMKGQLRNKKSTTRSPMSNWTKSTRQIKIPTQKHPPRCIRTRRCCTCVSWSCSAQKSNRRKTRTHNLSIASLLHLLPSPAYLPDALSLWVKLSHGSRSPGFSMRTGWSNIRLLSLSLLLVVFWL